MTDKIYTIKEISEKVFPIALEYGVERIYLFGSYARGEATKDSDIDFRVDRGKVKGLKFGALYMEISEKLDKSIDIINTNAMDRNFLDRIASEEVLIYGN